MGRDQSSRICVRFPRILAKPWDAGTVLVLHVERAHHGQDERVQTQVPQLIEEELAEAGV